MSLFSLDEQLLQDAGIDRQKGVATQLPSIHRLSARRVGERGNLRIMGIVTKGLGLRVRILLLLFI